MSTDVFDDDDYINTAGMGSPLPVQATELLRGIGSQILRSLLVAAPGDIPEEFGCSPEEAAVALACCELAELPAWDEAALIDAATVGGIEEARVMWGHQSRNQLARRISLAMKAEKAPEVMSPADGVLLLRRAGINVFHQLLDAVAIIALDGPEPERNYRLLKGIAEPQTAPATDTATPAPVAVDALDDDAWGVKARLRAAEIIKRQREKDLYPSQINLGDEIAREFRTAGIVGTDGKPLSGAYIKRHALNGISSAQGKQLSTQTGRGKQGK